MIRVTCTTEINLSFDQRFDHGIFGCVGAQTFGDKTYPLGSSPPKMRMDRSRDSDGTRYKSAPLDGQVFH